MLDLDNFHTALTIPLITSGVYCCLLWKVCPLLPFNHLFIHFTEFFRFFQRPQHLSGPIVEDVTSYINKNVLELKHLPTSDALRWDHLT